MSYLKAEYILLFKDAWHFNYIKAYKKQELNGIGSFLNFDGNIVANFDALSKYHGVKITYHPTNKILNVNVLIESELQQYKPVAIDIDGFFCPWLIGFQKVHIDHGIVISRIDLLNKTFTCTDSFYQKKDVILPFDCFDRGILGLYTYELTKADGYNYYNILEHMLLNFERFKSIEKLIDFRNDFEAYFDFAKEIEGFPSYEVSVFYINIDRFRQTRKKVSKVLEYMGNKKEMSVICKLSEDMLMVYKYWDVLHRYLLKCFISNASHDIRTKAVSYIENIINAEKEFCEKLKEALMYCSN